MRKPNSIIVLLHIFSGLFTLKCVNFGSFQEQWWKRWSNVFCVHQNFDRITVTISKSLLMAEDTPTPQKTWFHRWRAGLTWNEEDKRVLKTRKEKQKKSKEKKLCNSTDAWGAYKSLEKLFEPRCGFFFSFFFLFLFLFFCFFKWRGSQSNFKHN